MHRLLVLLSALERSTAICKAKPCRELASLGVNAASVGLLRVSAHEMTGASSLPGEMGKLLLVVLKSEGERNKDGVEHTFGRGVMFVMAPPVFVNDDDDRSSLMVLLSSPPSIFSDDSEAARLMVAELLVEMEKIMQNESTQVPNKDHGK